MACGGSLSGTSGNTLMIVPPNFCASCKSPTNSPGIISLSCQLSAMRLCSLTGEATLRQPRAMNLQRLHIEGRWFVDEHGRRVILRGVNLGGDCKVPWPDGGTNHPSDFSDHREVSFIGRPFPLDEADEHLARIAGWGFNTLRLLTTWEAVEHRGPGQYDSDYLDYLT